MAGLNGGKRSKHQIGPIAITLVRLAPRWEGEEPRFKWCAVEEPIDLIDDDTELLCSVRTQEVAVSWAERNGRTYSVRQISEAA
jgi:hypothetical protein